MTSIDIADTRRLWGDRVTMGGGIRTVVLTDTFSEDEFEALLEDLFRAVVPGDRFILGFGDNLPTDASFGRVKRIAEFWAARGSFALGVQRCSGGQGDSG